MAAKKTNKPETKATSFASTANAKRRVERHLRKHTNDAQSATALKNGLSERKKPNARMGWVQEAIKSFAHPKPVSRHVGRDLAQVLSFSRKVSHTPITKAQRVQFKNINAFDPAAVKVRQAQLQAEAVERKEAKLAKKNKIVA